MREVTIAIILAMVLIACTHTTRVKYESPDRQLDYERHMEMGGRA